MSRCRIIRAVQSAIVIVSLAGGGAARAQVVLGASFRYTHLSYSDLPDFTNNVFGIPGAQVSRGSALGTSRRVVTGT